MTTLNIHTQPKIISLFKLIRLHKPTGVVVLWWPTAWALWIASAGTLSSTWLIFILGSLIMRSAGCIWNDISDADIDPHVERTACRPIAAGDISINEAISMLIGLLCIAALIAWQLPLEAFKLCILAVSLTILYPLTKRWFKAPQLFLGLAFAMSVPIAFATYHQLFTQSCLWLYIAAIIWPLVYDTIYALSDKKDDVFLNIHSLPLTLGNYTYAFIDFCQCMFVLTLVWVGFMSHAKYPYFIFISLYGAIAIAQQVRLRSTNQYQKLFCSYQWLGAIIMLAFVCGITF